VTRSRSSGIVEASLEGASSDVSVDSEEGRESSSISAIESFADQSGLADR